MKHARAIIATVGLLALVLTFTSNAQATLIDNNPPELEMTFQIVGEDAEIVTIPGQALAGTRFRFGHTHEGPVNITVEAEADPDPFVTATLTCINLTGSPQSFTTGLVLQNVLPPLPNGTITGGSVSFTLLDTNGDGATFTTNGALPIYQSGIDGNNWQPLWSSPQSWSVGANQTVGFGPAQFGTPIPSLVGPPALNDIQIELNATLSAWDQAFVVATFVVEDIPEPGTMAMLTIGGLTVLMRRKRRTA